MHTLAVAGYRFPPSSAFQLSTEVRTLQCKSTKSARKTRALPFHPFNSFHSAIARGRPIPHCKQEVAIPVARDTKEQRLRRLPNRLSPFGFGKQLLRFLTLAGNG